MLTFSLRLTLKIAEGDACVETESWLLFMNIKMKNKNQNSAFGICTLYFLCYLDTVIDF